MAPGRERGRVRLGPAAHEPLVALHPIFFHRATVPLHPPAVDLRSHLVVLPEGRLPAKGVAGIEDGVEPITRFHSPPRRTPASGQPPRSVWNSMPRAPHADPSTSARQYRSIVSSIAHRVSGSGACSRRLPHPPRLPLNSALGPLLAPHLDRGGQGALRPALGGGQCLPGAAPAGAGGRALDADGSCRCIGAQYRSWENLLMAVLFALAIAGAITTARYLIHR